jgi:uncharacterized protein
MELSKHNIISRLKDDEGYFIVNLLSGSADLLSPAEAELFLNGGATRNKDFIEKGYVVEPGSEDALYKQKYLDFIDQRENDEIQLFFVPTYACNFNCSYCYQDEYGKPSFQFGYDVMDAFFDYIENEFLGRKKYLTIFGGEPLLPGARNREIFNYLVKKANESGLELAVVTNGHALEEYMELLAQASIREIQVTLDGVGAVHDQRRPLKNGQGTFDNIVKGIDKALANDLPVNLRVVIDKENMNGLPDLARFAIEKKWTEHPLFKTQLGRNYELHHCQGTRDKLYTRLGMYEDVYQLLKDYPELLRFHKPAFSISRFLFENGELPAPLYDSCPGTKTEWAFDYTGKIYSCTATVGKAGEELGSFYPVQDKKEKLVAEWEERDVLSIHECKDCHLQLACGGGCASVAKNEKGKINAPDCRPVKELLELGISYYRDI